MSMSPRRDGEISITGVIIVAQNITELSEYRENLEKKVDERTRDLNSALVKEKELVDLKSRFVSIASHEFRTPLSSISLASGFIRKYKLKIAPEEIDKKLESIEKQVRHMTYLLDDVLMIGKSEAGKIKANLTKTNIKTLIANLVSEVSQSTRNTHQVNLKINLKNEEFVTDEKLMRNILINLLTNAIKFSPEADQVDMAVSMKGRELQIKIRDFGVGIPAEDINKLFEPFYRAGNVTDISGTGLGLSIIKKAVDLLNGLVVVESEQNKWTEFRITLPVINE
jgi:signal transduction histidine kinase